MALRRRTAPAAPAFPAAPAAPVAARVPPPAADQPAPAPPATAAEPVRRLLEHLWGNNLTLAVAESCTGGLLGARITEVPGASEAFVGGVVAYRDDTKTRLLGVPEKILQRSGAVSAACVEAMAHGVRERLSADMAIAVSGVAGPHGGTARKPVGTVWVAVLGPERLLNVHRLQLDGDRDAIRRGAVEEALRLAYGNVREAEKEGVAAGQRS